MKKAIIVFFIGFAALNLFSQQTVFEETVVKYNKEMSAGLIIHSNGWGVNGRYGKFTTGFTQRLYEIEISSWKNPREIKSYHPIYDNVKGYVIGKLNTATMFRPSIGYSKTFIAKQSLSGVSLSYNALVGPTIAFIKPVYLIIESNESGSGFRTYSTERYDPDKHRFNNIYSRASFLKGLDEIKLYPGLHTKLGLNFEYANNNDVLKAIEVGLTADAFLKEIPIMAFTENRQFYLTLSVNLLYGVKKIN